MGSGHVAYYRHGQNRRKAFSRLPSPVVDQSESAGTLKMLLLHRQAVLVRIGGKVGGIEIKRMSSTSGRRKPEERDILTANRTRSHFPELGCMLERIYIRLDGITHSRLWRIEA
jgi:hypothetical protein